MDKIKNTNEIVIIEQKTLGRIDDTLESNRQKIMARDGSKVYPITAVLRKKLEALKDTQLGDIKTQLRFIKTKKYEEFLSFNKKRINELKSEINNRTKKVTKVAWGIMKRKRKADLISKIKYVSEAKDFYKEVDEINKKYPEILTTFEAYEFPLKNFKSKPNNDDDFDDELNKSFSKIQEELEYKKQVLKDRESFKISLDENRFIEKILKVEFEEKFGKGFKVAENKVNELEKQFNEALIFGDMEVTKQIYYNLKEAEKFLDNLDKLSFK